MSLPRHSPEEPRRELKYLADGRSAHHLAAWLKCHRLGFGQPYPPRQINNAYFDSPDHAAYSESLAGVSSRTKLRYRWYGTATGIPAGQLEVKFRRNGLGWKHTHTIAEAPPPGADWRQLLAHLDSQVSSYFARWLHEFSVPVLINRYRREYWATPDGRMRATIDTGQAVYDQRFGPRPSMTRKVNLPSSTVLELKYLPEDQGLIRDTVAGLPLTLTRHSKYCVGFATACGS